MRNGYIILKLTVMYLNAGSIFLSLFINKYRTFLQHLFIIMVSVIEPIYIFIKIFLKMKATLQSKNADLYVM